MALTEEQQWSEIYKQAVALKQQFGSGVPTPGLKGRSIVFLARRLTNFWQKHRATLIPVLSQLAIAALEAVAQNIASIEGVNNPGPQ